MQPQLHGLHSRWMILRWGFYLAILAALAMGATILDVSDETSTVVHTGDTLILQLLTWNFGVNAAGQDQPLYPTDVNFALVSAPLSGAAGFAATLESADGTVSLALGDLMFGPGNLQSSGYTGAVSVLKGHLHLSLLASTALFSASSVVIALQNEGPEVTVGLAPYLLRQSVYASLSGGSLSVGAIPGSVKLESQDIPVNLKNFRGAVTLAADSEVPEPHTGGLLFWGGVLLCGLSAVLARVSRGRKQGYRAKNQPFASANPL
jgi:hypothetical protein